MLPKSSRRIRNLLSFPPPRAMTPDQRLTYRVSKRQYAALSFPAKTLYNANARGLTATIIPS